MLIICQPADMSAHYGIWYCGYPIQTEFVRAETMKWVATLYWK